MVAYEFALWVEPIAEQYRARRAGLIAFAQSMPSNAWTRPSGEGAWTCKDLLAHVAGDTGQNLHRALQSVIAGQPLPAALFSDIDAQNARDVDERRGRSVGELTAELEVAGQETQRLLSQLATQDETRVEAGLRGTLRDALAALSIHDEIHLAQLRKSVVRTGYARAPQDSKI